MTNNEQIRIPDKNHVQRFRWTSGGIIAKDFVHYLPLVGGMLLLAAVISSLFNILVGTAWAPVSFLSLFSSLTWLGAFAFSFAPLYEEFDRNSWGFLRSLPISPRKIIGNKLINSIWLTLLFVPLCGLVLAVVYYIVFSLQFQSPVVDVFFKFPSADVFRHNYLSDTVYLTLCALPTGIAAVLLFPRKPIWGVAVGISSIVLWFQLVTIFPTLIILKPNVQDRIPITGTIIWLLFTGTLIWFLAPKSTHLSLGKESSRFSIFLSNTGFIRRIYRKWPMAYALIIPSISMLIVSLLIAISITQKVITGDVGFTVIFWFVSMAGICIGLFSTSETERMLFSHQIYQLPISRSRLFLSRSLILITHCVVLLALVFAPLVASFIDEGAPKNTKDLLPFIRGFISISLLGGGLVGMLMRFLVRTPLLAAIPAALILFIWLLIFAWTAAPRSYYHADYHLIDIIWAIIVTMALPFLGLWLLHVSTSVLEMSDRSRLPALLLIIMNLLIWGIILILIFPSDIWFAITG